MYLDCPSLIAKPTLDWLVDAFPIVSPGLDYDTGSSFIFNEQWVSSGVLPSTPLSSFSAASHFVPDVLLRDGDTPLWGLAHELPQDNVNVEELDGQRDARPSSPSSSSSLDALQSLAETSALPSQIATAMSSAAAERSATVEAEPEVAHTRTRSRRHKKTVKRNSSRAKSATPPCHNQIEKNYRTRLNRDFQRLRDALESTGKYDTSAAESRGRPPSKGTLLKLATQGILALHAETKLLASEAKTLKETRPWPARQVATPDSTC